MRYVISALGLIVLAVFVFTIDFGELGAAAARVRPGWLAAAAAFGLLNVFLKAERWRRMVRRVIRVEISVLYAVASVFAGVAGASLLPGRAFEVTKPMMLRTSHDAPLRRTVPAVLFERLLDLAALFALFLAASLAVSSRVSYDTRWLDAAALAGLASLAAAIAWPRRGMGLLRRLTARLGRLSQVADGLEGLERFVTVWEREPVKLEWLSLSAAAMLAEGARVYAVFAAFDVPLSPASVALAFTGSVLIGLLSLIPGGVGVTETSQFALLAALAPDAAAGALRGAVLLDRFVSYYLLVGIGALVLLWAGGGAGKAVGKVDSASGVVDG